MPMDASLQPLDATAPPTQARWRNHEKGRLASMVAVTTGLLLEGLTIGAAFAAIILLGLFACVPLHAPPEAATDAPSPDEIGAALHGCTTPDCAGERCHERPYARCSP
jgi:hypothetical protein